MRLIYATWNTLANSVGDSGRFRRQMAIMAGLGPSVVALQFSDRGRLMSTHARRLYSVVLGVL